MRKRVVGVAFLGLTIAAGCNPTPADDDDGSGGQGASASGGGDATGGGGGHDGEPYSYTFGMPEPAVLVGPGNMPRIAGDATSFYVAYLTGAGGVALEKRAPDGELEAGPVVEAAGADAVQVDVATFDGGVALVWHEGTFDGTTWVRVYGADLQAAGDAVAVADHASVELMEIDAIATPDSGGFAIAERYYHGTTLEPPYDFGSAYRISFFPSTGEPVVRDVAFVPHGSQTDPRDHLSVTSVPEGLVFTRYATSSGYNGAQAFAFDGDGNELWGPISWTPGIPVLSFDGEDVLFIGDTGTFWTNRRIMPDTGAAFPAPKLGSGFTLGAATAGAVFAAPYHLALQQSVEGDLYSWAFDRRGYPVATPFLVADRADAACAARCSDVGAAGSALATVHADAGQIHFTPLSSGGVCAPDAPSCDGSVATTCNAGGDDFVGAPGEDCAFHGETCVGGTCQPAICEPNGRFCVGEDVTSCNALGNATEVATTCDASAPCQHGNCLPIACPASTAYCDGDVARTCNATGDGWTGSAVDCAATSQHCFEGACVDCRPGWSFCDGNDVMSCDGTGAPMLDEQCASDEHCIGPDEVGGARCAPEVCEPGAITCRGDFLEQCNHLGTGPDLATFIDCGDQDLLCRDASCTLPRWSETFDLGTLHDWATSSGGMLYSVHFWGAKDGLALYITNNGWTSDRYLVHSFGWQGEEAKATYVSWWVQCESADSWSCMTTLMGDTGPIANIAVYDRKFRANGTESSSEIDPEKWYQVRVTLDWAAQTYRWYPGGHTVPFVTPSQGLRAIRVGHFEQDGTKGAWDQFIVD